MTLLVPVMMVLVDFASCCVIYASLCGLSRRSFKRGLSVGLSKAVCVGLYKKGLGLFLGVFRSDL